MQLLSPAQLILVLWLIAAAAPVATVLINGAMVPCGVACAERADKAAHVEQRTSSEGHRPSSRIVIGSTFGLGSSMFEVPPQASVLHTAVQRHRPRVA